MNRGEPANTAEVVRQCLLAECDYPQRLEAAKGLDRERLLAMPDEEVLSCVNREWNRELVAEGAQFYAAEVSVGELDDCYYREAEPWSAFTGGSFLLRDGAKEFDALDDMTRRRVEWAMESDGPFGPLLIYSPTEDGPKVIVHGAARATAHVRRYAPGRLLDAFWGLHPGVTKWPWWPSVT